MYVNSNGNSELSLGVSERTLHSGWVKVSYVGFLAENEHVQF